MGLGVCICVNFIPILDTLDYMKMYYNYVGLCIKIQIRVRNSQDKAINSKFYGSA